MSAIQPFIQPLILLVGLGIGLYQYSRSRRFERLKNLNTIWQRFVDTPEFAKVFELCNADDAALATYAPEVKLRYLALLESVSLFVELEEADSNQARYLFQWHFHFVFNAGAASDLFWKNIGGAEERDSASWSKSQKFARLWKP